MSNQSMSEMTFYLNALIITIAVLAALMALVNLLIFVLRPVARRNAVNKDFEQIGHEATVVKTIRPGKPGQIRYVTADGFRTAPARADTTIRSGHAVLILSVAQRYFRVRRLTEAERKALQAEPAVEPAAEAAVEPAAEAAVVSIGDARLNEPPVRVDPEIQISPDPEADR